MDDMTFRQAMGKFATGVTVISTCHDGEIHGMTANAVMSVSLRPKLIAVSIDEKAQMHEIVKKSGEFAVNILSKDQQDISMRFAGQKKAERSIEFDWIDHLPVIPQSLVTIVCRVYNSHKAGDHTIYIGEVLDITIKEGMPLTFFEGKYGQIKQN